MKFALSTILLLAFAVAPVFAQDKDQPGDARFHRLDTNGDQTISRQEFPRRLAGLFDRIDANQDGVLTLAEDRAFRQSQRQARGEAMLAGVELRADIPYAGNENPRQRLDLMLPKKRSATEPLPVIAFIHGGAWRAGDKRSAHGRLARYVRTGEYAAVSIGYRLSQEAIWPAQIHDCQAAIRWIVAHAEKDGLDPKRIAAWGTSAGGHLAAMLGVCHGVREMEGDIGPHTNADTQVACVLDFFGPTDLLRMHDFPSRMDHDAADSPESQLVGGPLQQLAARARSASPLTYVTADDAPFLLAHGTADPLVPFNQSELLHAALKQAGVPSTLITVEGGGHGFRSARVEELARLFLEKHLLGKAVPMTDQTVSETSRER